MILIKSCILIIVRHRLARLNIDVLQANLKRLGNFVKRILNFYLYCPRYFHSRRTRNVAARLIKLSWLRKKKKIKESELARIHAKIVSVKRRALEEKKQAKEEAERLERYERFMSYMAIELCEKTVLVFYPWVFKDERGRPRDKLQSPPYTELVQDLFRQCFDVQEELRVQLNEDMIEKMFVESDVDITEELIKGTLQ